MNATEIRRTYVKYVREKHSEHELLISVADIVKMDWPLIRPTAVSPVTVELKPHRVHALTWQWLSDGGGLHLLKEWRQEKEKKERAKTMMKRVEASFKLETLAALRAVHEERRIDGLLRRWHVDPRYAAARDLMGGELER